LQVTTKKTGDTLLVNISGRLDSNTCVEFGERVEKHLDEEIKNVICDLQEVEYVASAGLRILLKIYKTMNLRGGETVVSAIPDFVRQVFEIAGFDTVFKCFDEQNEARKYLADKN